MPLHTQVTNGQSSLRCCCNTRWLAHSSPAWRSNAPSFLDSAVTHAALFATLVSNAHVDIEFPTAEHAQPYTTLLSTRSFQLTHRPQVLVHSSIVVTPPIHCKPRTRSVFVYVPPTLCPPIAHTRWLSTTSSNRKTSCASHRDQAALPQDSNDCTHDVPRHVASCGVQCMRSASGHLQTDLHTRRSDAKLTSNRTHAFFARTVGCQFFLCPTCSS